MKQILKKILNYINQTYDVEAEIVPRFDCQDNIYIKTKQYDLNIEVEQPGEDHYLYGKSEYVLNFDYEANKKYRTELQYHSGSWSEAYNDNDYSNIDEFLEEFCKKRKYKQMSIFDYKG